MDDRPGLEIVGGPGRGARYALLADMAVIGSAPECDVPLEDVPGVSRRHAELLKVPGGSAWRLRDLDSRNGTLVEGARITEVGLTHGMEFSIGKAVLRFLESGGGASAAVALGGAEASGYPQAAAGGGALGPEASRGAVAVAPDSPEAMLAGLGGGAGRTLATLLLLGGMLALAVYGATWFGGGTRSEGPWTRIFAVNQEKVLYSIRDFNNFEVSLLPQGGGKFVDVREYNGLLAQGVSAANARLKARGYQPFRFLVAQGRLPTDGLPVAVRLKNAAGAVVESIPVLIAGRVPRGGADEVDLDDATRSEFVNKWVMEARILEADGHLYLAMRNYQNAERLASDLLRSDKAMEFSLEADRLRARLAREAGERFQRAIDAAYPDRTGDLGRRDVVLAYRQLDDVKRMIPDETSPDWQVADYWQMRLARLIRAR